MTLSQASSRTRGSRCSCEDCDSAECFTKRYLKPPCSCELCNNSQTCLYFQKLRISEPTQVTKADIPTPPSKTSPVVIEPSSNEIPESFTNTAPCCVRAAAKAPKFVEKVTSKSSNTAKSTKPSKIPISTDKVFSKSNSITKAAKRIKKNLSRSSSGAKNQKDANLIQELIKKEVVYVYDRNNNTQTTTTKESKVSFRNIQADNYMNEDSIVNGVDDKYSDKDMEFARSTARLAAQIMNVPYTDFQSSVPESKSSILQQVSKYPIDIFKRIKEAYKACSCKVCECIGEKAITADDICKCKPCDCNDCKHLTVNVFNSNLFPVDDEGCPCIRCDRKNCKGIKQGNKAQPRICDCQMTKRETKFGKGCDCEPCQCIDCSLKAGRQKDFVVARVNQNYLNMCDCSPCECADCLRSYGISNEHTVTTRREMSTGVNRHPQCQCEACITEACVPDGNELCWCVRHSKVMSKPFQRDTPDYDIRRANLPFGFEPKDKNRNNTLAMYASIKNTYPQKLFDYQPKCSCDPCECLVCNHEDNRECLNVLMEESVTNYEENRVQEQLHSIEEKMGEYSIKINKKNCGCDFCDCENCKTKRTFKDIPKDKSTKKMCLADTCSCRPCECLNAENQIIEDEKLFYDCQQFLDDNDFQNQAVPQPYSTLRNTNDPYLENNRGFNYNDNVSTNISTINHIPTKDREEINVYENYPYNRNCYQSNIKPPQYVSSRADKVKLNSGICTFSDKEETDFKELKQSPSVNSSMSCLKDSESLSPLSRNKKKSADSSCNSSGHDYPDYLIHFPKTTVQKCIDDVMTSNFMNAECVKVNYMNKPPPMISTSYKNSIKYKPIPNPPSFMQQNNETPNLITDNRSLTTLNVVSKHTSLSSKSSIHRTSGVIAIETSSKKVVSQNDGNMIETQKLSIENNSPVLEDVIKSVDEKEVSKTKIKKHVTVNPMHDDLDSVQNTLTDAREFSKQLVQLLEKYERANENFDNVSKKFNITDYPTSSEVKLQREKQHSRVNFKKDTDVGSTQCSESQNDIRLKKSTVSTNETSIKYIQNKNQSKSKDKLLLEDNQSKSSNSVSKVEDDKSKKAEILNENRLPKKTNKNKVCLTHFNKNDVSVLTEPAYIFKTVTDNNNPLKPTKSCNVKDFLNTIAEEKISDILSDVYKANSEKKDRDLRKKRNFNYMYKRTMTMSKKMNIMPRHENVKLKASVVTEESKTTPEGTEIKRNAVFSSKNDDLTKNVSKDNVKPTAVNKNSTIKTNLQDKTDKNQNIVVIKSFLNEFDNENAKTNHPLVASKNYQLETESNDDLGHVDPTLSNLDLKEALRSIPLKPKIVASDGQTVFLQENKALINLQSEVKKLLDMPLLQPFMEKINDICNSKEESVSKYTNCSNSDIAEKDDIRERSSTFYNKAGNSESKSTNCSKTHTKNEEFREFSFSFYNKPFPKNKYSSLKVNYVDIRQISVDSVLVKWDAPQNLNYVEGYEVLIDGKAVHKIQNPNKCNAVVTGLPISDNDKILLSIRTVTNIPNIERMPATTIIYRPQLAVY